MVDGDQNIGFGKISGYTFGRNIVSNSDELVVNALLAVVFADQIQYITRFELFGFQVVGVHQDYPAFVVDAPVAIVQAVDGRVELIVGTDGHHQVLVWLQAMARQWSAGKMGFAVGGAELLVAVGVG